MFPSARLHMEGRSFIERAAVKVARWKVSRAGVWFVDIPRTSSTSIKVDLGSRLGFPYGKLNSDYDSPSDDGQFIPDHVPAWRIRNFLGERLWGRITSFTVVRNPWDRTLSLYNYRLKAGYLPSGTSFHDYVKALGKNSEQPHPWFEYWGFRYGAADYVLDQSGSDVIVDHVFKLEERDALLEFLDRDLGLKDVGVLRRMVSGGQRQHYSESYDADTSKIVQSVYGKDLELFGYKFES